MKYVDKTDKYNACAVASKTCKLGGWRSSCMYAYPGNAAISGKPESYKDVCTMQRIRLFAPRDWWLKIKYCFQKVGFCDRLFILYNIINICVWCGIY